jgi:hypothetical protein
VKTCPQFDTSDKAASDAKIAAYYENAVTGELPGPNDQLDCKTWTGVPVCYGKSPNLMDTSTYKGSVLDKIQIVYATNPSRFSAK